MEEKRMGLENALTDKKIRDASFAIDIACAKRSGKWSDLSEEHRALAVASARTHDQFLGIAGMVMAAGAFENLHEVLGDPCWQASMAPNAQTLEHLRASLGQAFGRYPLARKAIADLDDASMWLGVLGLSRAYLEMAHPSRSETFFSLNAVGGHDAMTGKPEPFEPWEEPGKHDGLSDYEWKAYASALEAASLKVDAKLFERLPWLKKAAAGAILRAMVLDSGPQGLGVQDVASMGVESAKRVLESGGDCPELRDLMLFWAAGAKRQSLAALELCKQYPAESTGVELGAAGLVEPHRPMRYAMPDRVDAAWLCAAKTFDQAGVDAAIGLRAAYPSGETPTALLKEPRPTMKHPLDGLAKLWENAKRANIPLPASAMKAALERYKRAADELGEDWGKIRADWDELAAEASKALLKRELLGDFPGGPPPDIHEYAKSYRVPVSPLQWRLQNPKGNAQEWARGLGSPRAIEHCALASAALGYPIEETMAVCAVADKAVLSGVEAALLRLASVEGGAKPKSAPRL